MIRAFYSKSLQIGEIVSLSDAEAHHIFRVLRARYGENLVLLDGQGHSAKTHVLDQATHKIQVDSIDYQKNSQISLYPALVKNKAMDILIREATAIGVEKIIPVHTDRCEVTFSNFENKLIHWENIAKEACKQSGNPHLPVFSPPQELKKIRTTELSIVASLTENSQPIDAYREEIQNNPVSIFVGPEGDFSSQEYQFLADHGMYFVRLGKNILRTETAVLYILSVVDQMKFVHF